MAPGEYEARVMAIWTPDLDITTVPDAVLIPEAARRNGSKRKSYSGGKFWVAHNPDTARCRCAKCSKKRAKKAPRPPDRP